MNSSEYKRLRYIAVTKFRTISKTSRYRYLFNLFRTGLDNFRQFNAPYAVSILKTLLSIPNVSDVVRAAASRLIDHLERSDPGDPPPDDLYRSVTVFLEHLGRESGINLEEDEYVYPWRARPGADEKDRRGGTSHPIVSLPVVLFIPHIRSPFNLGGVIRTAASFGLTGVVTGTDCPSLDHPRLRRAAMGALNLLPVVGGTLDTARSMVPLPDAPVIILEQGGQNAYEALYPPGGVLVVGHEELGVSRHVITEARAEAGSEAVVLSIPHRGPKASLNVGVAAGILLAMWDAGASRSEREERNSTFRLD